MSRLQSWIIHPYLLAAHPVLFLYSHNVAWVSLPELAKPLITALAAVLVLFLAVRSLIKDDHKAGLVASLAVLSFFLYGPVIERFVLGTNLNTSLLARHRISFPAWIALSASVMFFTGRSRFQLRWATLLLNLFAIFLVAQCAASALLANVQLARDNRLDRGRENAMQTRMTAKEPLRDIYYIILDEYASNDVLKQYFSFDNKGFIEHLRHKGFYVADKSRCNYVNTVESLSSSLNCDYIAPLIKPLGAEKPDARLLIGMIRNSKVMSGLKGAGYKFVFLPSIFRVTGENPNSDINITPPDDRSSEFIRTLYLNSILRAFDQTHNVQRRRVFYQFDQLGRVAAIKEPTFTFVHIVCPHGPYVFDRNGNWPGRQSYSGTKNPKDRTIQPYLEQVRFVNSKVCKTIDTILAQSDVPPVIIIQADHGPRMILPRLMSDADIRKNGGSPGDLDSTARAQARAASGILNAYYLPDRGDKLLYPTISPVNTFRTVLSRYFDAHYQMLDDISYRNASDLRELK